MKIVIRSGIAGAVCGVLFSFGQNIFAADTVPSQNAVDVQLATGTVEQGSGFQFLDANIHDANPFGLGSSIGVYVEGLKNLGYNLQRDVLVRTEYQEHRIFGQHGPFFSLGLVYYNQAAAGTSYSGSVYRYNSRYLSPYIAVTQNFGENSYFGFQLRKPFIDQYASHLDDQGDVLGYTVSGDRHAYWSYIISYGWNSFDNSNFPSQGSEFRFAVPLTAGSQESIHAQLGFKKVWSLSENSTWNFGIGSVKDYDEFRFANNGDLPIDAFAAGFGYGFDLKKNHPSDTVRSSRLSLDVGFRDGISTHFAPGAKLSWTMDVKGLGFVNLFFFLQKQ